MAESRSVRVGAQASVTSQTYIPVAPAISDEALIAQLKAERDRYAVMLMSAEQELAKLHGRRALVEQSSLAESAELESYKQAYALVVRSHSWRVTRPLREAVRCGRIFIRSVRPG